jgi:uncharacterized FlaG/YvyC family protein
MNISSSNPSAPLIAQSVASVPPQEATERRQLVQAAKSVNASGTLGQNQLVFAVDPTTHHVIMRVENRDTGEVILQVPPENVMQMAEDLNLTPAHTMQPDADT